MDRKNDGWQPKCPVTQKEIEHFRSTLMVGETIWVSRHDGERERKCRVVWKYPHFCLLADAKGMKDTLTYVQLICMDRQMSLDGQIYF